MSRTCHSVIYTFVCAGGRDRSPFPFQSSFKPVRSYRVPIRKGGRSLFSLSEIREKKRRKREGKKMKAAMSYEARFSRIKLAKVAARMERFDRRSYFEAKFAARMPRPCACSIYQSGTYFQNYTRFNRILISLTELADKSLVSRQWGNKTNPNTYKNIIETSSKERIASNDASRKK